MDMMDPDRDKQIQHDSTIGNLNHSIGSSLSSLSKTEPGIELEQQKSLRIELDISWSWRSGSMKRQSNWSISWVLGTTSAGSSRIGQQPKISFWKCPKNRPLRPLKNDQVQLKISKDIISNHTKDKELRISQVSGYLRFGQLFLSVAMFSSKKRLMCCASRRRSPTAWAHGKSHGNLWYRGVTRDQGHNQGHA